MAVATLFHPPVANDVPRDATRPAGKVLLRGKLPRLIPEDQAGFLEDIVGIVRVGHDREDVAVDLSLRLDEEGSEFAVIAL